jgi:CRP/FNR family transcriptional regulator, cyclic AMP receptor protein
MLFDHPSFAAPDLRERAARLLISSAPMAQLTLADAMIIVDSMEPVFVTIGTVVMEEGETEDTGYMALVLEGELRAEAGQGIPGEELVISMIGPGGLLGDMGAIDGSPRSATCTALTDVKMAILSSTMLLALIDSHPAISARLLLAICTGMSARLRENNRRLKALSSVSRAVQMELDATHAVNRRLLGV